MAASVNATDIQADELFKGDLPVYSVELGDTNAANTLKEQVITDQCELSDALDIDNINIPLSSIDISGLNSTKTGIQKVTFKVNLVYNDNTTDSVGYSFTQEAAVNVKVVSAPQLKLKATEVTVNNGDTFNPESYISFVNTTNNELPALTYDLGGLDMTVDGDYTISYKAVDNLGNTVTQSMLVHVKTPQEVLDYLASEEAAAQAEAEAEAQRLADLEASNGIDYGNIGSSLIYYGGGSNPYGGGWSNCTYGAWQALYNATGIELPNFGDAGYWVSSASAYGYATGMTAQAGSIVVYSHHVAYVESVNADGTINIVEGGYAGHANARTVSAVGDGFQTVIGYIYP